MCDVREVHDPNAASHFSGWLVGIACAGMCVALIQQPSQASSEGFRSLLIFDVMSTAAQFTKPVADHLVVHATRDRTIGLSHPGWDVSVQSARESSDNLLYHSLQLHGPHPSQLLAWHFTDVEESPQSSENSPGGAVRTLPVYGYPWEIRLECSGCRVRGADFLVEFVSGSVRISARRLQRPNPPQLR